MSQLIEIIEKFNNGHDRYGEDPNFTNAVDCLRLGVGVYAVLDKALNQLRVLREIHAKTIEQNKRLTEEADNLKASNRALIENNIKLTEEADKLKGQLRYITGVNHLLGRENIQLTEKLQHYESN